MQKEKPNLVPHPFPGQQGIFLQSPVPQLLAKQMRGNSPSGNAPWLTILHDKFGQHGFPPSVHDSPEARQVLLLQIPVREPGTSTQSLLGQQPPMLHLPPGRIHFVIGTDA